MLIYVLGMVVLSFANVFLVKMLDVSMDYTNILQAMRLNRATKLDNGLIADAKKNADGRPTGEQVNIMNDAYFAILFKTNSKWLKSIMCIQCMTIRINAIIQLAWASFAYLTFGEIGICVFGFIASLGLNYYFYEL